MLLLFPLLKFAQMCYKSFGGSVADSPVLGVLAENSVNGGVTSGVNQKLGVDVIRRLTVL